MMIDDPRDIKVNVRDGDKELDKSNNQIILLQKCWGGGNAIICIKHKNEYKSVEEVDYMNYHILGNTKKDT